MPIGLLLRSSLLINASVVGALIISSPTCAGEAEKKIAAQCLAKSIDAASYAICLGKDLTLAEIRKCFTSECLGKGNTLVQFNNWFSRNILGSSGFKAKRSSRLMVINDTRQRIRFFAESEYASGKSYVLKSGYWRELRGHEKDTYFNIHFKGESYGFDPGAIVAFEYFKRRIIVNDVTPRQILVTNECHRTLQISFRFRQPGKDWGTEGWWTISPNDSVRLADKNIPVIIDDSYVYYYAELTHPRLNHSWSGSFSYRMGDRSLPMRDKLLDIDRNGNNVLTLTCRNLRR